MTVRVSLSAGAASAIAAAVDGQVREAAQYAHVHCITSHVKGWGRRSGDLMGSYRLVHEGPAQYSVVTDSIPYAPHVEYGTIHMPAQKHMQNAGAAAAARFGGEWSAGG